MAGFEQKDNSGVLFKNEKKTEDKHPLYKGQAMIDGQEYWISAWLKDGKNGKFMSLAFELKKEQNGNIKASSKKEEESSEDSMPF